MSYLNEKVSYLRGLAEGLGMEGTKEQKIINAIIDTLEEFADAYDELESSYSDLRDYVDTIDDDLADIENELYEEDDNYVEVECPNCHETVYVDEDIFDDEDGEIVCPNCNETIYVKDLEEQDNDFDDDNDED